MVDIEDITFGSVRDIENGDIIGICGWKHPESESKYTSKPFICRVINNKIPEEFINHKKKLLKISIEKEIGKHFKAALDIVDIKGFETRSGKAKQLDKGLLMEKVNKLILKYWFNHEKI